MAGASAGGDCAERGQERYRVGVAGVSGNELCAVAGAGGVCVCGRTSTYVDGEIAKNETTQRFCGLELEIGATVPAVKAVISPAEPKFVAFSRHACVNPAGSCSRR